MSIDWQHMGSEPLDTDILIYVRGQALELSVTDESGERKVYPNSSDVDCYPAYNECVAWAEINPPAWTSP